MSSLILLTLRFSMVIALYTFLVWALYLLWRDLKDQRVTLSARQIPTMGMIIYSDEGEHTQTFTETEVLIGRSPTCEITLQSDTISAQHAILKFENNQWWLEDLGSTNGTFLNNDRVEARIVVANGDLIRCGDIKMTLSIT